MDWTGGVRRRFAAGKNNAVLQKQKAHFAKVRSTLHNTPSTQRTFRPDFLHAGNDNKATVDGETQSLAGAGRSERVEHGASQQRHIERDAIRRANYRNEHGRRDVPLQREQVQTAQQPSVMSVSPGTSSSSTPSSRTGRRKIASPSRPGSNSKPPSRITQDEQFLMTNRRRLLARTDWLGLSVARPLHMRFSSIRDKDRIGKRRKIEKSGHRRSKPAGHRLLTPLFEERLLQPDHLMSGALPVDDIQIKIGTDAFASQTQRSRHSQTPANTSMRQPSTEFGPLSEESMLLGEDGDSFEAERPVETPALQQHVVPPAASMIAFAGIQLGGPDKYVPESPEMRLLSEHLGDLNEKQGWRSAREEPTVAVPGVPAVHEPQAMHDRYNLRAASLGSEFETPGFDHTMVDHENEEHDADRAAHDTDDGEETWRHILNIQQYTSSNVSRAAVRSSSLHNASSGSSRRSLVHIEHDQNDEGPPNISTPPHGFGTQAGIDTQLTTFSTEYHPLLQSPSLSLKQITRLAEQSYQRPSIGPDEDSDNNALWKGFIFGSQDDDSDSSQQHEAVLINGATKNKEEPLRPNASSALAVSGIGTSDKATLGDTLFVSPSSGPHGLGKRRAELLSSSCHEEPMAKLSAEAVPVAAEDHDSIEESEQAPTARRRPSNIHVSSKNNVLNPFIFEQKKQKSALPTRKGTRRLTTKIAKAPKQMHSIYDLVDSDGLSLA